MLRAFMVVPRLEYSPGIRHITLLSRAPWEPTMQCCCKDRRRSETEQLTPRHGRLKSPPWSGEHELLGNMNHWARRPCAPRAGSAWGMGGGITATTEGQQRAPVAPCRAHHNHQANSTHAAGRCHVRADRPDRPQPSTLHPSPAGSSGRAVISPQRGK
ncbi:hypothetical protein BT67DRAFT_184043 [Trichocladium antarcticum]|uniref:Uncharacterized protein n=1 Tax=Trichocladium antarcticum TaxID=1450529 RepID=A0AAN6ZGD9_9PEZI|nr:hypothetical protein BT67DRAFT_184043 [Trichocladium antarcticum]